MLLNKASRAEKNEASQPLMEKVPFVDEAVAAPKAVDRFDRAGLAASFLCAIHCALLPFVVTMLPVLGLSFLASEPVEWALLAASATLGTLSLCLGYREHRSRRVFAVLAVALALLVLGRLQLGEHSHAHGGAHLSSVSGVVLMVLGGLAMMGAHGFNHLLCRACRRCASDGCN